jgi:CRP/FNR family cyclic AMP-dependent transcriptional regulator
MRKAVQVLIEDPDLAGALRGDRLEAATRDCVATVQSFATSGWSPEDPVGDMRSGFGLLVLDGLLLRRVGLGGRFGAELLGAGDLLRPWQPEENGTSLPRTGRWRVLQRGRMAVLDGDFALRACRHPEVIAQLFGRAVKRSRHVAVNMAIIGQPRIDIRLHMLLWELADRYGTVGRDGVRLPLRLTHAMLGELVAARRPTVTKSLGDLADRGAVRWTGREWLLSGEPPVELQEFGEISVPRG